MIFFLKSETSLFKVMMWNWYRIDLRHLFPPKAPDLILKFQRLEQHNQKSAPEESDLF